MAGVRRPQNPIQIVEKEKKVPYRDMPHDEGEFVIGPGKHEIVIDTENVKEMVTAFMANEDDRPIRVWVCLEDTGNIPVCMGNLDKSSTIITDDGFILYLEIHSTERKVKWYAEM